MTFDEQNVNRDATGQFGVKTGSAPEARLVNEHRERTAHAIARNLALTSTTGYAYGYTVVDNGDIRISRNGEMFATVALDEDGMLDGVYDARDVPLDRSSQTYSTVATTVRNSLR